MASVFVAAVLVALAVPALSGAGSAQACHEHQLITPGTTVEDIARGQTDKESGEGGYHQFHLNVHIGEAGQKIGNDKGAAGLPNNPVTVTGASIAAPCP